MWLNTTFLGSWIGDPNFQAYNQTLQSPHPLQEGQHYVLTVLVDNLGLDLNAQVNTNKMKSPRGLLDFALNTHVKSDITWKITGNLGGEQYHDHTRGPLNESSMFAERQGYHLPGALAADDAGWEILSPKEGLRNPGVGFFATSFNLDYPEGYDIPSSVVYTNSTAVGSDELGVFRIQLFVNGWQFGKYSVLTTFRFFRLFLF